jgi:hypothetical protein
MSSIIINTRAWAMDETINETIKEIEAYIIDREREPDSNLPSFFSYTKCEKIRAARKVKAYCLCIKNAEPTCDLASECRLSALKQGRLGQIVKPIMLHYELGQYVKMREQEQGGSMWLWFGLTFGFEKSKKISAAKALQQYILGEACFSLTYLPIIQNGRLGKIIRQYADVFIEKAGEIEHSFHSLPVQKPSQ